MMRAGHAVGSEKTVLRLDTEIERTSGELRDFPRSHNWKRVQIHAAVNRGLELLDVESHPKKANSYDEMGELLPTWEK